MEDEKPSIEDIILGWKQTYGTSRTSERGKTYTEISRTGREELFHYLHATLLSYGYTAKEITRPNICYFLAELCWSDEIYRLSNPIIERKRKEEIKTWKGIVLGKQISFVEQAPPKKEEKAPNKLIPIREYEDLEEEIPDLEYANKPVKHIQDDPKYNTSQLPPIQANEELLAKLNAIKTTLGNKK